MREVRDARGLVVRDGLVAVVHRPAHDDWSLPKAELDPGETWEHSALRGVEAETGLRCTLTSSLETATYTNQTGWPGEVRYVRMEVAEDRCLDLSSEANELRWLTPGEASEVLTYDCDRAPVRALDLPADTERTVSWTLASRVSLAAMGACLATVVGLYLALHGSPQATPAGLLVGAAAFFVGIFAHEGVHGLGFRAGGLAWSQIGFGFHWQSGSPYAHAHAPMRASAYRAAVALPGLVTGLAPLVVFLALGFFELTLASTLLFSLAAGDWLILVAIRGVPRDAMLRDHPSEPGAQIVPGVEGS